MQEMFQLNYSSSKNFSGCECRSGRYCIFVYPGNSTKISDIFSEQYNLYPLYRFEKVIKYCDHEYLGGSAHTVHFQSMFGECVVIHARRPLVIIFSPL